MLTSGVCGTSAASPKKRTPIRYHTMSKPNIGIAGACIGGLAAAIALREMGHDGAPQLTIHRADLLASPPACWRVAKRFTSLNVGLARTALEGRRWDQLTVNQQPW